MIKPSYFIDPLDTPISRRGSYLCFAAANGGSGEYGRSKLYLGTCRGGLDGVGNMGGENSCRQVTLELLKNGQTCPVAVSTTVSEVLLQNEAGELRFCLAEKSLALCSGKDGMGLRLTGRSSMGSTIIDLPSGAWRFPFADQIGLLVPLKGSIRRTAGCTFEALPDENGELLLGMETYDLDPGERLFDSYPAYDDAVKALEAEFDAFCNAVCPSLPAEFEPMRKQALYNTWSLMVEPGVGTIYKHPMVKMMRFVFESAFGWQQAMQAMFLSKDIRLAWDVLRSSFDAQDANGRVADSISHASFSGTNMKPPFQGVALKWLMENRDLSGIPTDEKKALYDAMARWTNYFFRFRDQDGDGVWENLSMWETGWEDAVYFYVGFPLASPDMNAYTVIMMDALAMLGKEIGLPAAECEAWTARADALTEKIIRMLWNGERWVCRNVRTGAVADSLSLPMFAALILGKRLPQEIIDKTVHFLFSENGFATPYGFASESVHSSRFRHGFSAGSVITPAQLILCMALEAAGASEAAKEMGLRYARTLRDNGFFHIHDPLDGHGDRTLVAFGEKELFWSSWASSCYLFLAERYGA